MPKYKNFTPTLVEGFLEKMFGKIATAAGQKVAKEMGKKDPKFGSKMSRVADLKKENQELEKQASIKEGIFEADNRRTRALKESLEIQEKILRNERLIKKLQNLDDLEKKRNLEKELQNFQKSGLTALKKRFDLSSLEKKVNDYDQKENNVNKFVINLLCLKHGL